MVTMLPCLVAPTTPYNSASLPHCWFPACGALGLVSGQLLCPLVFTFVLLKVQLCTAYHRAAR